MRIRFVSPWTVVAVVGGLLATATVLGARPGRAAEVRAGTNPEGAHVAIGIDGSYVEEGRPGGTGASGARGCTRRWEPVDGAALDPGVASYLSLLFGPAPSPAHRPFSVYCDADFVGAAWLLPGGFTVTGTVPTAAEVAALIARDLPYPRVAIGANPAGRGLTGLESWFWVDGYDGAPIANAVASFGTTVEVEARPSAARWDFGDESAAVIAEIGGASTTHQFETRSDSAGFAVRLEFSFAVRYRVDGGPWLSLPPVERDAARAYPVAESRAQLVPSDEP